MRRRGAAGRFAEELSSLIERERYREALGKYEQGASSHLETCSPGEGRGLLLLGARIYYFNQKYDKSGACLEELERTCEGVESDIEFVIIKSQVLSTTGDITGALGLVSSAISENRPQSEAVKLTFYLGKIHFWNGDYFEANNCFQQCCRYYLSSGDQYMLGSVNYMLGYTAFQRSFFDVARSFYEKALERFIAQGKHNQIGGTYHMLGILAYRAGRYEEAKELLESARDHFEKCYSRTGIMESKIALARVSIYLEAHQDAERLLLDSCRDAEAIGYKRGMALSAEFLGEIFYHRVEYEKALQNLETAKKLALEIAPQGDIAVEVYRRLGDLHIARGELERAEECLSKALEIGDHLGDRCELGTVYRAYGLLFARRGDIDRARSYFMESSVTLQAIGERYELARSYITAADMYRQWCGSNTLPVEYENELLREADTCEVEALHLYQSLGLDGKVNEVEARRKGPGKAPPKKAGKTRFKKLSVDGLWLCHEGVVAVSPQMREAVLKAERLAPGGIPVYVTGETGTGKDVVAGLLHRLGSRSSGLLVPVNCAAIADAVFESEMFGHKRGSFTGAIGDKTGLLEMASGGTLFLDEISELTDRQQAKLLRALEDGVIRRVGETKERAIDVRLVSASNGDIGAMLDSGKLRADFYFRVCAERIDLAPLRERREDIVPLFAFYLGTLYGVCRIERGLVELLEGYHWPGNVRELINVAKALVHLGSGDGYIRTSDLPLRIRDPRSTELAAGSRAVADGLEAEDLLREGVPREPERIREVIVSSLGRCCGNRTRVARELGVSRSTLYRWMSELEISG
mgnify:CR=1 FL=1